MKRKRSLLALAAAFLAASGMAFAAPVAAPKPTRLPLVRVRARAPGAILLDWRLPRGWRLDPDTPVRWRFSEVYAGLTFTQRKGLSSRPKLPIRIPFSVTITEHPTGARLSADYRYCLKSGAKPCRDGYADYLVILQGDERESRTEVPMSVQSPQP